MRAIGAVLVWLSVLWLLLVTLAMAWWLSGACVFGACGPGYWWAWVPALGAGVLIALAVVASVTRGPAAIALEVVGWVLVGGAVIAQLVGPYVDPSVLVAVGLPGLGLGLGSALRRRRRPG